MASSSSANYSYDVFLSFRGTDTRNNFTSHLHKALCDNNVKVFIDNRMDRGEEITSFLEKIIEGIKLSIIVFSLHYASSTFCLDEMVKIMECKETKTQIVLPIFYKVYPFEEIYEKAFARHEQTSKQETIVERWRSSFQKALELSGWHIDDNSNEATVIEEITKVVKERLNSQFGAMQSTPIVGQTSEDYLEHIMQCLMNDENPKVGVWGMGGVGKTTIVTHIYNRLLNDATFSRRIYWVTVSKDSSVYKLQGDIAKEIKLDLSREDNKSKRAAKLFNELKRINKFVLILDDVWEPFETEEVGIPLMDGRKLLLTTRYLRVCQGMRCQPIRVRPLFEHEALELFMKESKSQINDSREWREIVQSIVKECGGLPLAIVVIARTMRGIVEIRKWRNMLWELQKPCEGENPLMQDKVFKVLKFSYDRLPNDRCRQCFLYCSLFPEDHEFKSEDLIDYWIGEGLMDELDSRQAELDKGNAILDELIDSSLLDNHILDKLLDHYDSYRIIRMHDVIRDMARTIVKVGLQFQDPFESVQVLTKTRLKGFSTSAPHCSKLRTLVLKYAFTMELSDCFFANMQSLNVSHMVHIKSIPDSLTNLGNLKVLIIFGCDSVCIPSLAGLGKLRLLNLSWHQYLKEIPKSIEILVNLRVLDISMNTSLRGSFPSSVVEKLSHLQMLDLSGSKIEVGPEALISLEKLEILRVIFYKMHKLDCYLKSGHWRRLLDYQINYGGWGLGNWKKEKLLMYLQAISDVDESKGEAGIFLPANIQNLRLKDWESPIFYVLKNHTFADLQTIHIKTCKGRYLFTVDFAQQLLQNVRELCILDCVYLEEIIAREDEWVDRSNDMNYPTIVLPNLKMMFFDKLKQLRSIYRGKMVCHSLELIQIYRCNKLERLPFCMKKEGTKQHPTIILEVLDFSAQPWDNPASRWWNSVQWDDPNAKSMYQLPFSKSKVDTNNESQSKHEGEFGS